MSKTKKEVTKMIEIEGATQDEALENAKKEATKQGFESVSLKNIIMIKYSVLLYGAVKKTNE